MKKFSLILAALGLVSAAAYAGLPPTTSKVSGDSSDITTFKYQFPNFAGTHTGTTLSVGALNLSTAGATSGTLSSARLPADVAYIDVANTFTLANILSTAGAASTPALKFSGAPFTGGSASTTSPLLMLTDDPGTVSWPTSGTYIGVNAPTAFAGNLLELDKAGASKFSVSVSGNATASGSVFGNAIVSNTYIPTANDGLISIGTSSRTYASANDTVVKLANVTNSATSGTAVATAITPTYNQLSGSSANTDLLINRTETTIGSGSQKFIDAQIAGTSNFSVDHNGNIAAGVNASHNGTLALANGGGSGQSVTVQNLGATSAYNFNLPTTAGTSGQALVSQGGGSSSMTWATLPIAGLPNVLVNSAFDYWQAGTSVTIANAASTYQADQWYVKNSLGTNGVITFSQVAGSLNGSKYGASVKITTAPTAAQVNGTELYQVIENPNTLPLYNQTASFSVNVKALGNVNQVGCQFFYATSEVKLTTAIGSEQTATVSTGGFTTCTISGQALGTSMTTSGVVGVRIRTTTVSSGNTYDLNNGFVVEQAMLNLGPAVGTYTRQGANASAELAMCQRYYESNYDLGTALGTAVNYGAIGVATGTSDLPISALFKVTKRAVPTCTVWDNNGTVNTVYEVVTGAHKVINAYHPDTQGLTYLSAAGTLVSGDVYQFHWLADARI